MFTAATIAQSHLRLILNQPGLSEAEYARLIFGPAVRQDRVNKDGKWLERMGFIHRDTGTGVKRPYPV